MKSAAQLSDDCNNLHPITPDFKIREKWTSMPKLMKSIADTRGNIRDDVFINRVRECELVEDRHEESERQGCQGWASADIKDGYLAKIILGRIIVGS